MPLRPDTYKGKILALHGADDPVVPDDQTLSFWKEMRDAKANWEFVAYGKALHARLVALDGSKFRAAASAKRITGPREIAQEAAHLGARPDRHRGRAFVAR